jgi:hypothetical protein
MDLLAWAAASRSASVPDRMKGFILVTKPCTKIRLAGVFVAAYLVVAAPSMGKGHTPLTSSSPTAAPAQISTPSADSPEPAMTPTDQLNAIGSGTTERAWSGPPQTERPKTFWETVPPITPYPRPGNYYVAPSGPGYYTLWDWLQGRELRDRPKNPYLQWGQTPNPFFNADFRYLDDPDNTETFFLDSLKRIHLGDNWLFSTGGEVRDRYAREENYRLFNRKPLAGDTENYNLFRARLYGDLWYRDLFRVYAEGMIAEDTGQALPRRSSDVDDGNFLNLFVEVKLLTIADNGLYARVGRQELLFGSQRLISPSDWANVIRTFQGARATYHNDKLEFDAFWVQPVVVNGEKFDSIDDKQVFVGNWWKYRFTKDISLDAYYLYLENDGKVALGSNKVVAGYYVNTFGFRFVGQADRLLWDFEPDLQFGDWSNQETLAGASATGVGWWFKELPAKPTLWVYYDYASGDANPGVGTEHSRFNPLFPFGHQYFDSLDLIGRQNIHDVHADLGFFPFPWMRVTAGYHYLTLDKPKDALYDPTGNVVRQDPTGKAGTDVGNAISASVQFHLDNHEVLQISYGHLFNGPFIEKTAVDPKAAKDLDSFWVAYWIKW